jgi:hypothetical protein
MGSPALFLALQKAYARRFGKAKEKVLHSETDCLPFRHQANATS